MVVSFDRERPFNDLPPLPPARELETKPVLKRAIMARAAMAELKGACDVLPDQGILLNSLVLQEARASSAIENIVTTNDELYRVTGADDATATPAAKEVHRYREALWHGYQHLADRPLSTNLFIDVCRAIRGVDMGIRRVPGTRIARGDGAVVYTPPEGEGVIRDKLANLERFIHAEDDLDPLVKLAVMHYQFEAIHPFTDGNGRTGRIVNILYLVSQGLLDLPVLYLSGYILAHRADYYAGLRRVTEEGEWEPWVLYMLGAVAETAAETRRRIMAIRDLMAATQERVQREARSIYSKDLIELVFRQPYCRIRQVEEVLKVNRKTAARYLRTLEGVALMRAEKVGRDVLFVNAPLFALLRQRPEVPDRHG
jgi:Fic family protein